MNPQKLATERDAYETTAGVVVMHPHKRGEMECPEA
jgi:hypothetical protein